MCAVRRIIFFGVGLCFSLVLGQTVAYDTIKRGSYPYCYEEYIVDKIRDSLDVFMKSKGFSDYSFKVSYKRYRKGDDFFIEYSKTIFPNEIFSENLKGYISAWISRKKILVLFSSSYCRSTHEGEITHFTIHYFPK